MPTYCDYVEGGQARKMVTAVTGLDHLNGEEIQAQVDGRLPSGDNAFTVSGGSITLPAKAAVVHAGLPYEGKIKLLKASDGSQPGTGYTKQRRIFLSVLRLYRTLGLKIGLDEDDLAPIFESSQETLFTGDQDKLPDTFTTSEATITIKQDQPSPAYILAVINRAEVEEKI